MLRVPQSQTENIVKKIIPMLIMLGGSLAAHAETIYVTDNLKMILRNGESTRHKIIKMLPSGTPLTVLKKNPATGYTKVRLSNGTEGYILTRYTQDKPISSWYLKKARKKLEFLQAENATMKAQLEKLSSNNNQAVTENKSLLQERDQLSKELNDLRQTAANAIQLKNQRDQLQERVITVERENQQLKRQKQALEDSTNQDWFLYGGILAFTGIFLGLIIPKIRWQRKTSNWDTF